VLVFQDITQRKQAAIELAEYQKQLESLVEKRTAEFSAINNWLNALNMIHQSISGVKDLSQANKKLSSFILPLLRAKIVFILRWESQGEQTEVNYCSLKEGSTVEGPTTWLKTSFQPGSVLRQDIENGKTILLMKDQEDELTASLRECFQQEDLQTIILAPLMARQKVDGVLGVGMQEVIQEITPQQVTLVEKMALDIANLSQNAVLLDQALALAMAEERSRLARDLHDSVTQMLFSASLMAELLPQRLRHNPDAALQTAADLRLLTRGALAEMRTLLLELRPSGIARSSLGELLSQLTEAISIRSGLPFQLYVDNLPPLPLEIQTTFYRIAQEL
jgi:signal transduction histidine kinase